MQPILHEEVAIPAAQYSRLVELVREYGPYRRDQLRLKLLAAAEGCRADAAHVAQRSRTSGTLLGRGVTRSSAAWEQRAREFEAMAEFVQSYRPPRD